MALDSCLNFMCSNLENELTEFDQTLCHININKIFAGITVQHFANLKMFFHGIKSTEAVL